MAADHWLGRRAARRFPPGNRNCPKSTNFDLYARVVLTCGLCLLLAAWLAGCSDSTTSPDGVDDTGDQVVGSGNPATQSRDVSGFDAVSASGPGEVFIDRTGTESLSITADDNILPLLESTVVARTLVVGPREGTSFTTRSPIRHDITAAELRALMAAGSLSVSASSIDTDALTIDLSGSTTATLEGRADRQTLNITGSGQYQAENLVGSVVALNVTGSGIVVVRVSDRLEGQITGSGRVEYIGDPVVAVTITGSGSVSKR